MDSDTKQQLQHAIICLENLIESDERQEAKYQEFFENNPIVFTVLGYKSFHPFTKASGKSLPRDEDTGLRPEPDFIVERDKRLFEIFEIKTPTSHKLLVDSNKYRERFTAEVADYISQTTTYEKYFTRNPVNRKTFRNLFNLDIHEDMDIKIVIGRDHSIDKIKVHQKCREQTRKIDVLTYDEVLSALSDEYQRAYGVYEDLPGFSAHLIVNFPKPAGQSERYFLDIGSIPDKNRASLYFDHRNDLNFVIIDDAGKKHKLCLDTHEALLFDRWIYLCCEFGYMTDKSIMSASINGLEIEKREKSCHTNLIYPFGNYTIGSDMNGAHQCGYRLAQQVWFSKTLTFRKRHGLYWYLVEKHPIDE